MYLQAGPGGFDLALLSAPARLGALVVSGQEEDELLTVGVAEDAEQAGVRSFLIHASTGLAPSSSA
jgi:hypothetical protein